MAYRKASDIVKAITSLFRGILKHIDDTNLPNSIITIILTDKAKIEKIVIEPKKQEEHLDG